MASVRDIVGSARARLVAGYVLVAAVFAALWLWSLYGPLTEAAISQQERNLTAVAQSAALILAESDEAPAQIARQLVARTDLRLTVVGSDGVVVADSDFDPVSMDNHGTRPEVAAALQGEVGTSRRASRTEGNEQLYVAVAGSLDGERVAVRIAQPLDEVRAIAARSRRIGLLLLAAALAIALAVALPSVRAATQPISDLSEAAERMAAGNLSVRIPEVPTDLQGLAGALSTLKSQMRARIDALEAERRTLRATLDGLGDAVLVLEGDKVRLANSAADRMFRAPAGGWPGASLESTGVPASAQGAIRELAARTEAAGADLDPDPTGRTLRLMVAPLEAGASRERTIVVLSDITERARLERVRRDFVANASHELKTPVAGIKLLAESAETAAGDGDDVQAVAFARQIAAEMDRLQRLVGDLLDLSRLEAMPAPDAVTDVRVAVDNALVSHRAAAARKGLELELDLSSVRGTDVFVAADPTDLAIALDNLIDNAITYTESGLVTVKVRTGDELVRIAVKDTGVGIPSEDVPRVFERFYRVDRGRSRESGGTGLGLALVRHTVERSGGSVTVTSEPGRGSTFTLHLRRAR